MPMLTEAVADCKARHMRSYGAALKEICADGLQEIGRWANNRAENSHLPFRR
jgi:putative transposase